MLFSFGLSLYLVCNAVYILVIWGHELNSMLVKTEDEKGNE